MKEMTLTDINELEDGMPIPQLFGHVKTVFERKSGEGEYGPWSFQDAILTDGNTDVRLKFKGMEDALSLGGKDVTIRANKSKQHGLTGVVKVVEQFDGKTYHKVQLTNSCKIVLATLPNNTGRLGNSNATTLGMAGSGPGEGAAPEDFIPMTHDSKGAALPGVDEARKHIMQSVNLYNLCVDAVDAVIKPNITNMTAEMFQAAVGTLFIEASRAGFVSKMPSAPLKK